MAEPEKRKRPTRAELRARREAAEAAEIAERPERERMRAAFAPLRQSLKETMDGWLRHQYERACQEDDEAMEGLRLFHPAAPPANPDRAK
jgi:hypothetical protein